MSIRQHRKLGIQLFVDVCFRLFHKSQRDILLDNGDIPCLRLARGSSGVNALPRPQSEPTAWWISSSQTTSSAVASLL